MGERCIRLVRKRGIPRSDPNRRCRGHAHTSDHSERQQTKQYIGKLLWDRDNVQDRCGSHVDPSQRSHCTLPMFPSDSLSVVSLQHIHPDECNDASGTLTLRMISCSSVVSTPTTLMTMTPFTCIPRCWRRLHIRFLLSLSNAPRCVWTLGLQRQSHVV